MNAKLSPRLVLGGFLALLALAPSSAKAGTPSENTRAAASSRLTNFFFMVWFLLFHQKSQ